MSRHRRAGWGGGGWPFMMYGQQPGGWYEQTMGGGYGQRPGRAAFNNDLCSPWNNNNNNNTGDQSPSLDALSSLFTRLILQNHLTRLAGDTLDVSGRGGLWGCSVPAQHQNACSAPPPSCQTHRSHASCGQQSPGCGGINNNVCGTNDIHACHTCPAATRPYVTNNVFVIPAAHFQQHQQQQQQQQPVGGGLGNLGTFNLNHNNLNTSFFNGLGFAMDPANGCGAAPMGLSGGGRPDFVCRGCNCNFQVR